MPVKTQKETHKELLNTFRQLGNRYGIFAVFEDFLAMYAIAISNSVDQYHYEEREAQYMRIVQKYDKQEMEQLVALAGLLLQELELQNGYPEDILGPVFHELELHNKYTGQFFSPQPICNAIAQMSVGREQPDNDKDYIRVLEPACGSGAMVLAAAGALQQRDDNYQQGMIAVCVDIDFKCVCMTYIQLALHGIPAVVIHGNTLSAEETSRWYTPMYFMGQWYWREPHIGITDKPKPEVKAYQMVNNPIYAVLQQIAVSDRKEVYTTAVPETDNAKFVEIDSMQQLSILESAMTEIEKDKPAIKKNYREKKNNNFEQLSLFGLAADSESSRKITGE